ncbi:MAG: response regulator [SAR324 cluster bacterium]|nr:response regulator [SAR324 cluster bacterium]
MNRSSATILLIEDSLTAAGVIVEMLLDTDVEKWPTRVFAVEHRETLARGLDYLDHWKPDIVLLDLNLPDSEGLDTLVRVHEYVPNVPIIVLTGMDDESLGVTALQKGAQDYWPKDEISPTILIRLVNYAIERHQLFNELEMRVEQRTSELRVANELLQENELRLNQQLAELKHIYNASPVGLCILSTDGRFLRINEVMAQISGKTAESHTSKFIIDMIPEIADQVKEVCKQVIQDDSPVLNVEMTGFVSAAPETKKNWLTSYYPVKTGDGLLLGVGMIMQDITEHKNLETQLRQSQKMESLGTLAGGIAHEFNNVLGIIQGYSQLLLKNMQEGSEEKDYIDSMYKAGQRAVNLVRQILTFSRMDEQQLRVLKIAPVIEESLMLMRATIPATVEIRQEILSDNFSIFADPSQLQQVIINLCANAVQSMQDEGGILTISLQEEQCYKNEQPLPGLSEGGYVKLMVRDTGCGIPADVKERIFDPFFTTKEVGKGTGLGLSITHSIVEQHGGAIAVESRVGEGSTFYIYFPMVKDKVQDQVIIEFSEEQGKGHIMVVDDELYLTRFYETMLNQLGYEVTVFNSSVDAREEFFLNPDQFDLVFTDYTMPHLTGDKLSEEVLKIRPDLPIVLATGYSDAISEEKAKEIGIREFFIKPVEVSEFNRIIQNLLKV